MEQTEIKSNPEPILVDKKVVAADIFNDLNKCRGLAIVSIIGYVIIGGAPTGLFKTIPLFLWTFLSLYFFYIFNKKCNYLQKKYDLVVKKYFIKK